MLRARHVLSTTGATVVSGGLVLGLTSLVARLLTPEQNGHYAQFVLIFNLVYIGLNFGLGPSSTFFVASDRASVRTVYRLNLGVLFVLASLVLVASWIIHVRGSAQIVETALKIPAVVLYVGLFAGILLLSFNQVVAILMGVHEYDLANALNVARAVLSLLLVGVAAVTWVPSVETVAGAQLAAMAIALLLAAWIARLSIPGHASNPTAECSGTLKAMLGYGAMVYLSNLLHYLAMRGLLLVLSYYRSPESVGFMSLALLLLEVTLLLPSAIGQLVFPQSSMAGFDHGALETVVRLNVYISLIFVVLIWLLAAPIVTSLMGDAYAPVARALIHITPSVVLLAVPRILSQLLTGQGHPRYPLAAAAIALGLGAAAASWAIPQWGYIGAAWVTNLVSAITAVVTMLGYCRVHHVSLFHVLTPRNSDWQIVKRLAIRWARR